MKISNNHCLDDCPWLVVVVPQSFVVLHFAPIVKKSNFCLCRQLLQSFYSCFNNLNFWWCLFAQFDISIGIFYWPDGYFHCLVLVLHVQVFIFNFGPWVADRLIYTEYRDLVFIKFAIHTHLNWIIQKGNSVFSQNANSCRIYGRDRKLPSGAWTAFLIVYQMWGCPFILVSELIESYTKTIFFFHPFLLWLSNHNMRMSIWEEGYFSKARANLFTFVYSR